MSTISTLLSCSTKLKENSEALVGVDGRSLTYVELCEQVNELGRSLREQGIRRTDRIAVAMPDGPELAVAFLGVASVAVFAPLNPAYKRHDFDFYLNDLNARAVLLPMGVESPLIAAAQERGTPVWRVESIATGDGRVCRLVILDSAGEPAAVEDEESAQPEDIALVLHTSGTTARPKIVPLSHGNLYVSADHISGTLGLGPDDRCLNVMPLFHIHGLVGALLASLAAGGAVICTPGFKGASFLEWAAAGGATWYTAVPTIHQAILEAAVGEAAGADSIGFRFIRSSSSALPPSLFHAMEAHWRVPVIESYGMSEAAHQMASNPLPPEKRKPASVGRPAGPEMTILDELGKELSTGQRGEVAIRGPNVMTGYERNPEANAKAFTEGWLRTGDEGYFDDEGYLFLTGRLKEMISRGGENIAPREIDEALLAHPEVAQAVAFAVPHPTLEEDVVAAVVRSSGGEIDGQALRFFVAERLADFKVPSRVVFVETIPKGPTGKLQRIGLHLLLKEALQIPYVAPQTSTESWVAGAFATMLKVEVIGRDDHFFALGGDSLRATRMAVSLSEHFGLRLLASDVFRYPTVALLSAEIDDRREDTNSESERTSTLRGEGVPVQDGGTAVFASFQQANFWVYHQMAGHPATYNALLPVRVSGEIDPERLREAFSTVVEQYEIYRTLYRESDEGLEVRVLDEGDVSLDFELREDDGSAVGFAERSIAALRADQLKPFDLERDCPLRLRLIRRSEGDSVVAVVFHHIANDGLNYRLFWSALRAAYEALAGGGNDRQPDPSPEAQYGAYARRQAARAEGSNADVSLCYWLEQFQNPPAAFEFPADDPIDLGPPVTDCEVVRSVGEGAGMVLELAREESTTPTVVYLSVYFAWLSRVFGVRDVVVGLPVDARTRPEDQEVMGCCINLMGVRQTVDTTRSLRHLIRQTRRLVMTGLEHADVPLLKCLAALNADRAELGQLFSTAFQYRNFVEGLEPIGSGAAELLFSPRRLHQFPLFLEVYPRGAEELVGLTYDPSLFRRQSAEGYLSTFCQFLKGTLQWPDRALEDVEFLDSGQRRCVTETWAVNRRPYPREQTVHSLFAAQAARSGAAVAIIWGSQSLTYAEMAERAKRLALGLRRRGITHGSNVGVGLPRSPEWVISYLAILQCGAVYVPLDLSYPDERLAFMIADAQLVGVMTAEGAADRLRRLGGEPLLLADLEADGEKEGVVIDGGVTATAPAYLMYTSGSTGGPKGVLIPHRGIVRLVCDPDYLEIRRSDVFMALCSPSFDVSTFDLWAPLLNGSRLVLLEEETPSVREIADAISHHGVTTLWLTAGLFHLVVDEAVECLRPLRYLLAGGDALSPAHVHACRRACPQTRLLNGYGPTENTTFSTVYDIPESEMPARSVPIGRPIANSEAWVLDMHLRLMAPGVPGNLYLGGDGLALGYWRRPELEAERFVAHPFATEPGARLYHSGDLARFRSDGVLEFLGRRDRQVKVRGHRVELDEVEAVLCALPQVQQCAVIRQEDGLGLIAGVVPVNKETNVLAAIREGVGAVLPGYMIPTRWLVLAALPLTAHGKLDRAAFAKLAADAPLAGSEKNTGVAPANALEVQVLEMWQRLLQCADMGCTDDFFALGGNSMLTLRFIAEWEKVSGRRLPLRVLFEHPTVRGLVQAIGETSREVRRGGLTVMVKGASGRVPLIVIHGSGGDLFVFLEFVREMGGGQPIYGVLGEVLESGDSGTQTLEAIAAGYAREIRQAVPDGPYFLMGYSLGGMIAFEVASQLKRMGGEIGRLIVLDTHPRNLPLLLHWRVQASYFSRRVVHHLGRVWEVPWRTWAGYVGGRGKALATKLARAQSRRSRSPEGAGGIPADTDFYEWVSRSYVPTPCPMPVTVMESNNSELSMEPAWSYLAGDADPVITLIDGVHLEMLSSPKNRAEVLANVRAILNQPSLDGP